MLKGDETAQKQYYLAGATLVGYLVDAESYDEARMLAERLLSGVRDRDPGLEVLTQLTHKHAIALEVTGDIEPAFERYQQA